MKNTSLIRSARCKRAGALHLFTLFILIFTTSEVFAINNCEAILKHGIWDKENILSDRQKHKIVRATQCNEFGAAGGGEIDITGVATMGGDASTHEKYCSSKLEDLIGNDFLTREARHASEIIANAWSKCIANNKDLEDTATHRIVTSTDPSVLSYKIEFHPGDFATSTKIKTFQVIGANEDCKIKKNTVVTRSGVEILCQRDPNNAVNIVATVDKGGKFLEKIELPAYEAQPEIVWEKPTGVIDVVGKWWKKKLHHLPNENCAHGADYTQYAWDGKSEIAYCQKIGTSEKYIVNIIADTQSSGRSQSGYCERKYGDNFEDYVWDGESGTKLCKVWANFDELKLDGGKRYIKKLGGSWPNRCPRGTEELFMLRGSNFRFCAEFEKLRPQKSYQQKKIDRIVEFDLRETPSNLNEGTETKIFNTQEKQ